MTSMKLFPFSLQASHYQCNCEACKVSKEYQRIISQLPEKERIWMEGFYNSSLESNTELEMLQASKECAK